MHVASGRRRLDHPGAKRVGPEINNIIEKRVDITNGVVPLYEEQGTYVGYLRTDPTTATTTTTTSTRALCPVVDAAPGFRGPAHQP